MVLKCEDRGTENGRIETFESFGQKVKRQEYEDRGIFTISMEIVWKCKVLAVFPVQTMMKDRE